MPISCEFLGRIEWHECRLELVGDGRVDLPGYAGSTIRGALGAVMRPALCGLDGAGTRCREECGAPGSCPFHSLFEQSRAGGGTGPNIPKPLILESPLGERLATVARGGLVELPYELAPGPGMTTIAHGGRETVEPGTRVVVVVRALGPAGAALEGMVEGVRRCGLEVKGGRLRLESAVASTGRLDTGGGIGVGRVRLALVTPTVIHGDGGTCFDGARLGRLVPDQAMIRAVSIYNAFFARRTTDRIPFVTPEWPGVYLTAHRLFRYRLPRQSYRQQRWMDFDGVVGWMEWEGPRVGALVPWLRAAEVLHVGQKATFGLGRVELVETDEVNGHRAA
jgi:hypothetical protein